MARKYIWTKEKYRAIVAGDKAFEVPSLRSIVKGFEAEDGYDLRRVEDWTPAQRAKVRKIFKRVEFLQAQPKRMVRAKGKNLEKLQEAFHGDVPSKDFKVAFIPDTDPVLTMPGAKKRAPKLRILKEGVAVQRTQYERVFIPFNKRKLVQDARAEIERVARQIPNATLYYVQTGEFQSANNGSIGIVADLVLRWMAQYDGVQPLPKTSGNKGDDPKHHHWSKWLNGLVGYMLPHGKKDIRKMQAIIREGREKNEEMKAERRRYMQRVSRKGQIR